MLHKDTLYIVNDNDDQSFVLALDSKTGVERWRDEREEHTNWSTPFVWENSERTELITAGSDAVRAYDLEGNVLWHFTGLKLDLDSPAVQRARPALRDLRLHR